MSATVQIRTQVEGLHRWPDAPAQVGFLRNAHRHLFKVEVEFSVKDLDREYEFFMVKHRLDRLLHAMSEEYHPGSLIRDFGCRSCETIAEDLFKAMQDSGLDVPYTKITVREDDENAGVVEKGSKV